MAAFISATNEVIVTDWPLDWAAGSRLIKRSRRVLITLEGTQARLERGKGGKRLFMWSGYFAHLSFFFLSVLVKFPRVSESLPDIFLFFPYLFIYYFLIYLLIQTSVMVLKFRYPQRKIFFRNIKEKKKKML